MGKQRRKYSAQFKTQVVLLLLSGEKSVAQLSREYQIKDSLLHRWKSQFLERAATIFVQQPDRQQEHTQAKIAELERMVGKLSLQLEIA